MTSSDNTQWLPEVSVSTMWLHIRWRAWRSWWMIASRNTIWRNSWWLGLSCLLSSQKRLCCTWWTFQPTTARWPQTHRSHRFKKDAHSGCCPPYYLDGQRIGYTTRTILQSRVSDRWWIMVTELLSREIHWWTDSLPDQAERGRSWKCKHTKSCRMRWDWNSWSIWRFCTTKHHEKENFCSDVNGYITTVCDDACCMGLWKRTSLLSTLTRWSILSRWAKANTKPLCSHVRISGKG